MPIYEFKCHNCQKTFEELCKIGVASIACPYCASTDTSKKVSIFAAQSTGSDGSTTSIGGGHSCASCHGGSCGSCH